MENPADGKMIDPSRELKIALIGPISNIVIGIVLLILNYAVYGSVFGILDSGNWIAEDFIATLVLNIPTIIFLIGSLNLFLGIFNILPIFPMDGGRVLRAWLAKSRSYEEATNTAVSVGKGFAIVLAVLAIFTFMWWIALLALFLYISAAEEGKMFKTTTALEGLFVEDIMSTDVITVDESMPLNEFISFVFQKKHPGYPVVKNRAVVGMITVEDARFVNEAERYAFTVKDVMKEIVSIRPDATALEAFNEMGMRAVGRLVVLDEDKNMLGILSRTDLMTAVYLQNNFKEEKTKTESI